MSGRMPTSSAVVPKLSTAIVRKRFGYSTQKTQIEAFAMLHHTRKYISLAVAGVFLGSLTGCAVDINQVRQVPVARSVTVGKLPQNVPGLDFSRLVYALPEGSNYHMGGVGIKCLPLTQERWTGDKAGATEPVVQRVKQALREGGANFVGDDAGLFPNAPKPSVDLQIAARVYAVELKTCSNLIGMQGAANVKVEWQIFSRRMNAVVLTTITEGSFKQSQHSQTTATNIRDRAVEAAAANLSADSRYRDFMMQQAGRG